MSAEPISLLPKVEQLLSRYASLLDGQHYPQWLDLFADDCFYGVIRYEDDKKANDFFIVADNKEKLRVRLKLGADTDARMRVHLLSAIDVDEVSQTGGSAKASGNFAVFCDSGLLYSGRYRFDVRFEAGQSPKIARFVAVIANDQPNTLFYLPI